MNRTATIVTLLVLAAGAVLGVSLGNRKEPGTDATPVAIQRAAPQSFGALRSTAVTQRSTPESVSVPTATDASAGTGDRAVGEPGFTGFRYVYRGDAVSLTEASVDVLERTVDPGTFTVGDYGLGLFAPGSFPGATVQSLTVAQADGYAAYIDAVNGTASISEVNPVGVVRDLPVNGTAPAVPDAQLTAIADAFLAAHGIDRAPYGEPVVTTWSGGVPVATTGVDLGLVKPEELRYTVPSTVTYPLRIEGRDAVGYGGEPYGLTVTVDAQRLRVTSVYNLALQRYRASAYDAVTDFAAVRAVAERGGIYGSAVPAGEGVRELELGTPTRAWLTLSRYDGSRSRELLVPALRFPVQNAPAGYASAVTVPLTADLLVPEEIAPVPLPAVDLPATDGVPEPAVRE